MGYEERLKAEAIRLGYTDITVLARDRAMMKRELRKMKVGGWKNEDSYEKLKTLLSKAQKGYSR